MSLYAEFIFEVQGKHTLEHPFGFATYSITGSECYVENVYVQPEHRKNHVASELVDAIAGIAKEKGCTVLSTSVKPSAAGSTASLFAILKYGFKLHGAVQDAVILAKEL